MQYDIVGSICACGCNMYDAAVAWTLATAAASLYVVVIRWCVPDSIEVLPRDHPAVIRFRLWRVSFLCTALVAVTPHALAALGAYTSPAAALGALGFRASGVGSALVRLLVLYAGPTAAYLLTASLGDIGPDTRATFFTLAGFRDHVFAPLTEELIYRSVVITCLRPAVARKWCILGSPLLFGVAHIHHAYEAVVQGTPLREVAVATLFQLLYTTLFGVAAARMFVGSGSLWCLAVLHAVCNTGGIPGVPEGSGTWKFVYWVLCVGGLGWFVLCLLE